jgi:hypothetical protein
VTATIDREGYTSEVRTSRKTRWCSSSDCGRTIFPGDRYVRHGASPRSEYSEGDGRWHWMYECAPCHVGRRKGGRVA